MNFNEIGYDQAAAEAAHNKLRELEAFVLDRLASLQGVANQWREVSVGQIRDNADEAVAVLDRKSKEIGAFANSHGGTGVNLTADMLAADRQLGSQIQFG